MRLADLYLKATMGAALAACGINAFALTPSPPEATLPAAAASAASAPTSQALTSTAVQGVGVGKAGLDQAQTAGTLRELEVLQRQTALAEARKRLAEIAPAAAAAPAMQTPSPDSTATHGGEPKAKVKRKAKAEPVVALPASQPAVFIPSVPESPKAKLVKLMVIGGHARADVLQLGRIVTVKEGDKLGAWSIVSIKSDGVTVEFRRWQVVPDAGQSLTPPPADGVKPAIAAAFPAAYAMVNAQPRTVERELVETSKLESADPNEINAALSGAVVPGEVPKVLPPTIPAATPAIGKPDSTSTAAVPPLPPALGYSAGQSR